MRKFLKIPMLIILIVLLGSGSAIAVPLIEVEGFVDPDNAVYTDLGNGTASLIGLEYKFVVVNSEDGAGMNALRLEFEDEAFASVTNPYDYDPATWTLSTAYTSIGTGSYYEVSVDSSGDKLEAGENLSFLVDVIVNIPALTDASFWQEGQVWGQSWEAADTEFFFVGDGGSTAPVPEPATMLLLGGGLAGMAAIRRRKSR